MAEKNSNAYLCCLVSVCVLNFFLGVILSWLTNGMLMYYDAVWDGGLPPITHFFFNIHWFPYAISALAFVVTVLTACRKGENRYIVVILLLLTDVFFVLGVAITYCFPLFLQPPLGL